MADQLNTTRYSKKIKKNKNKKSQKNYILQAIENMKL